ncbi:hypothetical protein JHK85_044008 [Glycine max]|nr:hypothetical protein JHK85_044008 [Glycine max]
MDIASRPNTCRTSRQSGFKRRSQNGDIKCNNDDTIFKEYHYFGDGICLSDEHGHFIKAKTLWQLGIPNPQEVDDWVLLQALKWIPNMDAVLKKDDVDTNFFSQFIINRASNNAQEKLNRKCALDSIPEYETIECLKDVSDHGLELLKENMTKHMKKVADDEVEWLDKATLIQVILHICCRLTFGNFP